MNNVIISNQEQLAMFDHPRLIERYATRHGIKLSEASHRFKELKKFLYICSISEFPCTPSKQIDDIWHEFVLYTKDYQDFCNQFLGVFIHHNPTNQKGEDAYIQTRETATKLFGSLDLDMWPQSIHGVGPCDSSCDNGGCET